MLDLDTIGEYVTEIEREKEAEAEKKKQKKWSLHGIKLIIQLLVFCIK